MKMTAFFGPNIAREGGGEWGGGGGQDEPKADQKNVISCRVLGRAFSHSPKLFCPPLWVTLSSISSVPIYTS